MTRSGQGHRRSIDWELLLKYAQAFDSGFNGQKWCRTCERRTDGLAYCLHCGTHQI